MKKSVFSLAMLLLFIFITSCEKDDENQPPKSFTLLTVDNNSNEISITPLLRWNASSDPEGKEIMYDVFLDTNSNPAKLLKSNLKQTEFQVNSPLEYSKTYYWKVVAKDNYGNSTESGTSSFQTIPNLPPTNFDLIFPEQNDSDIGYTPTLRWMASEDPENETVSYTILLDSQSSPTTVITSNLTVTEFTIEDELPHSSELYWTVIASDPYGNEVSSSTYSFTTKIEQTPPVYVGDLRLTSQKEVNDFGAKKFLSIEGSLHIGGVVDGSDITSLSALNTLTEISGELMITRNYELSSLQGLNSVTSVQAITILDNTNLTDIDALSNIKSLIAEITDPIANGYNFGNLINGNDKLVNIDGLSGVEEFKGIFRISYNNSLESINGLGNIKTFEGTLSLSNLPKIENLDVFNNFEFINLHTFRIENNPGLLNILGLKNITELKTLIIKGNQNLTSLDGLQNINKVSEYGTFENNNSLVDYCAIKDIIANDTGNAVFILYNKFNPTKEEILNGNCSM